jgi:cysteine desulfurase family protein
MSIYFDNAATSWPKPPAVREAIAEYFGEAGGNPGRSGHRMSIAAARLVERAREELSGLFNVPDPSRFVFTQNATHALNLALYGLLRAGDHVVTTTIEHNSVMRPLRHLEKLGVEITQVACSPEGLLDITEITSALRANTRLLVTTHGSNVTGSLMPIEALGRLTRERNILYLVDASQTAGLIPIDVEQVAVDLLAFSGHKALLGPTGTGALYIRDGIALTPLVRGGTGSDSAHEVQPDFMPDAYESGTLNVAGIAGLAAGVRFVAETGIDTIKAHEQLLVGQFLTRASTIPGISLYGPGDATLHCGVVSFNVVGAAPSEVALLLDDTFDIMARSGLHCSPGAHRTLGTFPSGTVRFSFSWFNTSAEVERALEALREIAAWAGGHIEAGLSRPWTA